MSDNSSSTYHGVYLSGNFEIEQRLTPVHGWRSEYRTYVSYIGCSGADRDHRLLYEIRAKGYSSPQYMLSVDHIYFLRGAFFPSNSAETGSDHLVFEGGDANLLSACEGFDGDLVDAVGITSLGIVVGISTIVEECCKMMRKSPTEGEVLTTVLTVEHADYHPVLKSRRVGRIEYLVRPTRGLAGIMDHITLGRECHFHGYIKDFNQTTFCYVVVVNKVYPTTGFQQQPLVPGMPPRNPDNDSKKPPKFVFKKITPRADFPAEKASIEDEINGNGSVAPVAQSLPEAGPSGRKSPVPEEGSVAPAASARPTKKRTRSQRKTKSAAVVADEGTDDV